CHVTVDRCDQRQFPLQALELPCPQTAENDKQDGTGDGETRVGPKGHDSRPSPALCLYCSTSSADLESRKNIPVRRQISGSHKTTCTQSGGWNVNSTHSARPQTMAPTIRIPNTIGPSPASNMA